MSAASCSGAGVVVCEDPTKVLVKVQQLMTGHRVWECFPAVSG